MKACSKYLDRMIMDIYGELDREQCAVWEKHLSECAACRSEKKRLQELVAGTRTLGSPPALSSEQMQFLSTNLKRQLRRKEPARVFKGVTWRLAPTMAACLILVLAGWFGLKDFRSPDTAATNTAAVPEEQIMVNNADLLENMELLQEMESLEKLAVLLEDPEDGRHIHEREGKGNNVSGKTGGPAG